MLISWSLGNSSPGLVPEGGNSKETGAVPSDIAIPATLAGKGVGSNLRSLHQVRTPGGNIFAFNRGPQGVSTGTSGHCLVTQHTQGPCGLLDVKRGRGVKDNLKMTVFWKSQKFVYLF